MERIKMKLIIAVTNKLSAAADCDAKTDLIEELSENLYERYLEYTSSGMSEEEAYNKTLEELGDVDELLAYLGAGKSEPDWQANLGQNIEELCRDAVSVAQNAVKESKIFLKDLGSKLKEKYPDGFRGHIHFNARDGEFWEHFDEDEEDDGEYAANLPAEGIRDIELQLQNSDVEIRLGDAEQDYIGIYAEDVNLDTSLDMEAGKLVIREPRTSSFFGIGSGGGDIEIVLPRRHWDSFMLTGANGDVGILDDLDAEQADIQVANGDVSCRGVSGTLKVGAANGDLELDGDYGSLQATTACGDIRMAVVSTSVEAKSASGDIMLDGTAGAVKCHTASGDVMLTLDELPGQIAVSSTSGDCRIHIPEREGFSVTYKTISGDFGTNFELTGTKGERTYLDGGNTRITASTVSGDITLWRR